MGELVSPSQDWDNGHRPLSLPGVDEWAREQVSGVGVGGTHTFSREGPQRGVSCWGGWEGMLSESGASGPVGAAATAFLRTAGTSEGGRGEPTGLRLAFQIEGFSSWGRSNKNSHGFALVSVLPSRSAEKAAHP